MIELINTVISLLLAVNCRTEQRSTERRLPNLCIHRYVVDSLKLATRLMLPWWIPLSSIIIETR